ncbi:hypothetical protein BDN72DRAFT_904563 [Pluteus cervinus]|uniref:Uncharacterized protein n=1 Tax=Pluteus cervinus TaxID=181527 RepID=A0ACD3A5C6_9AGAR|nr:hypothetical protein BDN72DRAFT_904563 [Pluteus cervinus]
MSDNFLRMLPFTVLSSAPPRLNETPSPSPPPSPSYSGARTRSATPDDTSEEEDDASEQQSNFEAASDTTSRSNIPPPLPLSLYIGPEEDTQTAVDGWIQRCLERSERQTSETIVGMGTQILSLHEIRNQLERAVGEYKTKLADVENEAKCRMCGELCSLPFSLKPCEHVYGGKCLDQFLRRVLDRRIAAAEPQREIPLGRDLRPGWWMAQEANFTTFSSPCCKSPITERPSPLPVVANIIAFRKGWSMDGNEYFTMFV